MPETALPLRASGGDRQHGIAGGHLGDPSLRVFACTTYCSTRPHRQAYRIGSGRPDYEAAHIPGSAFLDLQGELSDRSSPFNFTMPAAEDLAARLAAKGIGAESRVILYARKNIQWATRLWWMLRAIGFDGAACWLADSTMAGPKAAGGGGRAAYPPASPFPLRPRPGLFVGKEEMKAAIGDDGFCTIKPWRRIFTAGEPALRAAGRIRAASTCRRASVVDPASFAFRPPAEVGTKFAEAGADPSRRILLYCGGGIAATLDAFLLHQLGYADLAVYDASMNEWAKDTSLPIETDGRPGDGPRRGMP